MENSFPERFIEKYDKSSLLKDIDAMPEHLEKGYKASDSIHFEDRSFSRIIFIGMGGSAIAGFLMKSYLKDSGTIVEVCNSYDLPESTDSDTLVIAISYSGNTEETLAAFKTALRKGCITCCMSTGGKLGEIARVHRVPLIELPKGLQPRATVGYQFSALLRVMEAAGLASNTAEEVKRTVQALRKDIFKQPAISLSEKLKGRVPIIYSSKIYFPVAYRWQTELNENAKILAISNEFPELDHNEILGYRNSGKQGRFHAVILKSQDDSPRVQQRMTLTKNSMMKNGVDVTEIAIKGNSFLTRMFSALLIGDYTSYYLALRYETDPSPTPEIDWLKEELSKKKYK